MNMSEYETFTRLVGKVLAVPAETIKARVEKHRERAKRNLNKRGPKPKVKTSVSAPSDQPDRA